MTLEAVWFKDGKEVCHVNPVVNIVCDEDMKSIKDIEVNNGYGWFSSEVIHDGADDFVIRIMKN